MYIYIYIYMCVCVCECVPTSRRCNIYIYIYISYIGYINTHHEIFVYLCGYMYDVMFTHIVDAICDSKKYAHVYIYIYIYI